MVEKVKHLQNGKRLEVAIFIRSGVEGKELITVVVFSKCLGRYRLGLNTWAHS